MRKSLLEIYALIMCLIVSIIFLVSLHKTVFKVIIVVKPKIALSSYDFKKYGSNEEYTSDWKRDKLERYSANEITAMRKEALKAEIEAERGGAIKELIEALILLGISLLFFLAHWALAKKERRKNA